MRVWHWERVKRELGQIPPIAPPGPCTIPREAIWAIAVDRRCALPHARLAAERIAFEELCRLIGDTPAPPAAWAHAANRFRPTWWRRLRAALVR